jgi:hypothetical protein
MTQALYAHTNNKIIKKKDVGKSMLLCISLGRPREGIRERLATQGRNKK